MRRTLFPLFMVVAVVLLIAALVGIARAQGGTRAAAQLVDAEGNPVGTAEFIQEPNGVTISVNLQQGQQVVTPGEHGTNHMTTGGAIGQFIGQPAVTPGEHGIHIHETGDITPDFEAAGGHFNPTNAQHGFNNPQGPHAGDLENIIVNEDGSTSYRTTNALVTLSRGHNNSLLDSDGSALVIHAEADDYQTDPAGNSGQRVAAGVIRASTSGALPSSGGSIIPSVVLPAAALLLGSCVLVSFILRRR